MPGIYPKNLLGIPFALRRAGNTNITDKQIGNKLGNMNMTKTIKIAASALMVGAVALSLLPQSAQANPITGSVSFSGGVSGYTSSNGSGPANSDYTQDHSLVFSGITVVSSPTPPS